MLGRGPYVKNDIAAGDCESLITGVSTFIIPLRMIVIRTLMFQISQLTVVEANEAPKRSEAVYLVYLITVAFIAVLNVPKESVNVKQDRI